MIASSGLRIVVPIYRQEMAIRELNAAGVYRLTNKRGPEWLRRWMGTKRMRGYDDVFSVELTGGGADDRLVANFSALKNLNRVTLKKALVTDAGLAQLTGIASLETLEIESPRITDAGLLHLKKLPNLHTLDVRGARVTDAGLAELERALPTLTIHK
jgi:hypothetical protein